MKDIYPLYAKEFICIAGKCPDTCCAGWEIVIDKKFQQIYKADSCVAAKKAVSRMYEDDDGDVCLKLTNGRCPMLSDDNLCEIYIDMGKDALCDVCRIYPRFNKDCDNVNIKGISLSCPEAARLILEDESYGRLNSEFNFDNEYAKTVAEITNCLKEKIIKNGFFNIYDLIQRIQDEFIFGDKEAALGTSAEPCEESYLPRVTEVLEISEKIYALEILTDEWKELINKLICHLKKAKADKRYMKKRNDALKNCASLKEIKNIGIYYLYKYMPEAIESCDITYSGAISYYALLIICELYAMEYAQNNALPFERKLRLAQLFSKELEHNEDNLNSLL